MTEVSVDVSQPFDEPFFEGSGTTVTDWSLPVAIDGRGFLLDTASQDFQRKSIKLLNTQQAQTGQDYAIEPPTIWRRAAESWHLGADQTRYDRVDSIDTRYHRSVGVDPWTRYGFELLPDTTPLVTLLPGHGAILVSILGSLFVAVDDTVTHYASLIDPSPTTDTLPGVVLALTSDGENVYALCDDGSVEVRDMGGSWTLFYTVPSLDTAKAMLAYVKGFILLGNGPDLSNITSGSAVLVYTHPLTGWWWREAAEGLSVIYVLGGIGDRWHVHGVTIANTGASLDPPKVAATLPDGEVAYAIDTYMGYVLIGVNTGWRFAMPDSSGALTYGQLIETVGPVKCFEGQGRFVWYGLSVPTSDDSTYLHAGLGRADLSQFVFPMTPAYASDLSSQDYGVVRSVVTVGAGAGLGKRVFSVDGVGVYVESDNLVPSGWLEQGAFTFNSTDQKMGLYAQVFHESLRGTVEVMAAVDVNTDTFSTVGLSTLEGSVTVGNMPFTRPFNSIELRYILTRDPLDVSKGPRVVRSEFRAIDIPGRATEWHIPLLLGEQTVWDNAPHGRNVAEDYDYLMSLIRSRRQFIYREGDRTWTLHANDFVWVPSTLTSDRKTYNGTFLLIAREIS